MRAAGLGWTCDKQVRVWDEPNIHEPRIELSVPAGVPARSAGC
jgi:hypothetical protein